ncbi:hypothetical protein MY11210_000222 [Beauveria gryllotalpidicola]
MKSDECGLLCTPQQAQTEPVTAVQAATHIPDINASSSSTLGLVPGTPPPPPSAAVVTNPPPPAPPPLFLSSYTNPPLCHSPASSFPSSFTLHHTDDAVSGPLPPTPPVKACCCFAVRPSPTTGGGMGAFATRALLPNEVILEETPLFTSSRGNSIFKAFARASRKKQKKAMRLHASSHFKPGTPYLQAIWDTNSFATGPSEAGLFPLAARFNHACEPANNVHYAYDAARRRMRFWVAPEGGGVAEGQELTICYGRGKTPDLLYRWYGFRCRCGACEGVTEQEMDSFKVKW